MASETEIIMELAIGKCISQKLPSYMTNKKDTKTSVAEDVLFK